MIPLLGSLFFYLFIIHKRKRRCRPLGRQTPVYSFKLRLQKRHLRGFQRTSCPLVESLRGKASQIGMKMK